MNATLTPNAQWTVNSTSINGVVQAARALGAPVDDLLEEAGLRLKQLAEPEARHSVAALYNFYQAAASQTTEDIGLHAGRIQYINRLNLQLYTTQVCATFRDYLNLMPSVLRFAGDLGEVKIRRNGQAICLDWIPLWQPHAGWRYQSDEMLSVSAQIVNSLCVKPILPLEAHFTYPEPADSTLIQRLLGPNLKFDQPVSCLHFERESLDYPLIQLDADWGRSIGQTTQHLFTPDSREQILQDLRGTLIRLLPAGGVTLDKTAKAQGISRRTLQRRLAECGTQFAQVLQNLRNELAIQYLGDERLSITDIAFLLGYSEHSSFSSAFKQQMGMSPRDYRKGRTETSS